MGYSRLKTAEFFDKVKTEADAQEVAWRAKFDGKDFECPRCTHEKFYQYRTREIRECRLCNLQVRLRPGTLWENSKLPMLVWLRATFLMMQDKRGVSAWQVRRQLGLASYGTTWKLLHKIRQALRQRDDGYKLKNVIELDGAYFNRVASGPHPTTTLVAVESKEWVDERGRRVEKAGFAKVAVTGSESLIFAQQFVDKAVTPHSFVNTDGGSAFKGLKRVDVDYEVMGENPITINHWLPWVHRFISGAKTWILGTHHGIGSKYLARYLAEFTYRFNRRHDPDSLFFRALNACARATHILEPALFG